MQYRHSSGGVTMAASGRGSSSLSGAGNSGSGGSWWGSASAAEEGMAGEGLLGSKLSNKGSNSSDTAPLTWWGQLSSLQDSMLNQLQDFAGGAGASLADAAAFRTRLTYAIYLLGAAVGFGLLAVLIGLPTIVLRPSKFVLCITLSTLCASASVVVLQKPAQFLQRLTTGNLSDSLPAAVLFASQLATIYVTVVIHRYIYVMLAGAMQLLVLLYNLSLYIPGGQKGLLLILRMGSVILSTAMKPCLIVVSRSLAYFTRSIFS